jgi:Ca2+-binding EF-hand superfamily protein
MASNEQADLRKVSSIFESFDIDKDSKLSAQELKALIQQCNPTVTFTDVQLQAIVAEVNLVTSRYNAIGLLCQHDLHRRYVEIVG